MFKLIAIIILTSVSVSMISAQDTEFWTLEKCINYSHEHNIQIKRQELQSETTKKDYNQSFFNFVPTLNAGVEHSFGSGRVLNTSEVYKWENAQITSGTMGMRSELTLFSGLQNYNTLLQRRYSYLSSREDLEKTKNNITLQIMNYYLQVMFDEEILDVTKSQYEVTLLQVEKTKRLVDVGNVAMGQLYEVQAQAATEKLNTTVNRNKLQLSVLDLVQLLDMDSVGNFKVVHPENLSVETIVLPASFTEVIEIAETIMPEIKSARYEVKSAEKYLAVQRGELSPKIYLSGLYYSRYQKDALDPVNPTFDYPYANQLKDNKYSQITLGLNIPILNQYHARTSIGKAKINLEDSKLLLEQQIQVLYKNIQQAYTDALGSLEKYNSAVEAVKFNEEAFNYSQQKFDVGLVNAVDFNIAKNNLSKAKSELAQAKYEYIFKAKILDFYMGKPVQL